MTKRTRVLGPGSAGSQLKDDGCDCITLTDAVSMAEVSSRWVQVRCCHRGQRHVIRIGGADHDLEWWESEQLPPPTWT
jgi:hypothetical protein